MKLSPALPQNWQQALRDGQGVVAEIKAPAAGAFSAQGLAQATHSSSPKAGAFFFLESQGPPSAGRLSLAAGSPLFSFLARGERGIWNAGGLVHDLPLKPEKAFEALGRSFAKAGLAEAEPGLSPLLGWQSYEAGARNEHIEMPGPDPLGLPDWYLMLPGEWCWFDAEQGCWRFRLLLADRLFYLRFEDALGLGHNPSADYGPLKLPQLVEDWQARCQERLDRASGLSQGDAAPQAPRSLDIHDNRDQASFAAMVEKAKSYISAGDVFQVNLSHRLSTAYKGGSWPLFKRLSEINPSPYAAFADLGSYQILSSSPERLFKQEGPLVETHPIAGTLPRAPGDEGGAEALQLSEKDRAEHVMTVDIERNDFGRVCETGSVRVKQLMALETYSHLHHLVSRLEGRLKDGLDLADLFQAAFPGGSITGAPKVRCMQIIAELEGSQRGIYTGSLGYWDPLHQKADFNILIRTLILGQGRAWWQLGAGIVADSDPAKEWEETLHKGAALKLALETSPL